MQWKYFFSVHMLMCNRLKTKEVLYMSYLTSVLEFGRNWKEIQDGCFLFVKIFDNTEMQQKLPS